MSLKIFPSTPAALLAASALVAGAFVAGCNTAAFTEAFKDDPAAKPADKTAAEKKSPAPAAAGDKKSAPAATAAASAKAAPAAPRPPNTPLPPLPPLAAVPLPELDFSGDQNALTAFDRELNAAGKDPKQLAALEARLVDLLKRADASLAARQAAAQRLGLLLALDAAPNPAALKTLSPLLADPAESDFARLALEPVRSAEIDALFVEALRTATGRTRLGLIDSIAQRKSAAAVTALGTLLADQDAATAAAAATALGQIGTTAAFEALRAAPAATAATTEAQLALAKTLPAIAAAALYAEIQNDPAQPVHRRASALRALLDLEPDKAADRITATLAGADWSLKEAALESIFASRAPGLIPVLAGGLAAWDAPTQAAVLTAFGRRENAAATLAVVAGTTHAEPTVRAAAITALGRLPGSGELAQVLARLIAGDNTADAKLARAALARLKGPGVDAAILAGADKGTPTQRVVFLEQIALRNLTEGLPLLRSCRLDTSAPVRAAAIGAFGELAPATEQAFVLDWVANAKDPAEETKALRALVTITLRNPDAAKRAAPIFALLEKTTPTVAQRLIPALPRLGGKDSADAALRLALGTNSDIAKAAAATLARWPDRTAHAQLVTVAAKASVVAASTTAQQAALRDFERTREVWTPAQTALIAPLLGATTDVAEKKRVVALLNRAADKDALALAEKLQADKALGLAAKEAADCIAANLAGAPKVRVSAETPTAKNLVDGKTETTWRVPATIGQWIELDYGRARPLTRLTLDETGRTGDFPERYEVFVTDDPAKPGKSVVTGSGQRNRTVIDFPAKTRGRYVIVKTTADRAEGWWAIAEVFVD